MPMKPLNCLIFDEWEWHLDEADAAGNEINPDVIGYIFEKYINDRSQMGPIIPRKILPAISVKIVSSLFYLTRSSEIILKLLNRNPLYGGALRRIRTDISTTL